MLRAWPINCTRTCTDYDRFEKLALAQHDIDGDLMRCMNQMYVQGDDKKRQELEEAWHKAGVKLATKGPF